MTDIKAGDTVRQGVNEYRVLALADDGVHLWVQPVGVKLPPHTGVLKAYDKVEPFFEEGKRYRRFLDWSLAAQDSNVWEYFEVTQVLTEDDGTLRALGSHFGLAEGVMSAGGEKSFQRWELLGAWDFEHGNWKLQ